MNKLKQLGSVSVKGKYYSRRADQTIRQISSPTGLIVEYHVLRALEEQGFEFDFSRDNKSVYHPDELFQALGKYGSIPKLNIDVDSWKQAFQITLAEFGGNSNLDVLSEREQFRSAIKEEKASGAPLFCKKGDAFEVEFLRMQRHASGDVAPQPCVAYHRIQHGELGPKVRLVWGYPLHMTLLEAKFARPLIVHFLNKRSVMAFGLHKHELASRLVPIENSGVRYGFDFSKFDATLHPKLISMAFNVLKTHFRDGDLLGWERLVHYFIHTPIIMPDGMVYVKHHGVPSGSYFTQLVDSIINYFSVQYASIQLFGKPVFRDKVLVLGDDGLIGIDQFCPLLRWSKVFSDLGLNLNLRKSEVTKYNKPVTFLGHSWERGLVNRPIEDIAKRMVFPERVIDIEDPRLRILSRILAYGSDAINAHLIIVKWSRYKGPDVVSMYYRDVIADPIIGWREFQSGDRESFKLPTNMLDAAYLGILT